MSRERSAGLILFRERGGGREFLLVRSRRHGAWGFPKGHLQPGESDEAAARREAGEEAGIGGAEIIPGFRRLLRYPLPGSGAQKQAVYFLARCPAGRAASDIPFPRDSGEVAELRWADLPSALALVPFPNAREMLAEAAAFLAHSSRRVDYDRISGRYDRSRSFSADFARELAGVLPAGFQPGTVLDAGCGTGNATAVLRAAWPRAALVGVDLSAGMLRRARAKLGAVGLVRADACRLPLAAATADLVFSAYMLHHLAEPGRFYAEAARVLAPGGRLLLLTAGHAQIRAHLLNRFFPSFAEIDCARFPDLPAVRAGLAAAGLAPEREAAARVGEWTLDREYLRRVTEKHISTFELMDEGEFQAGLQRLTEWLAAQREAGRHVAWGTLLAARKD